jgi:hypothetical protein
MRSQVVSFFSTLVASELKLGSELYSRVTAPLIGNDKKERLGGMNPKDVLRFNANQTTASRTASAMVAILKF